MDGPAHGWWWPCRATDSQAEASIDWTILGQGAQAAKESDLLECVSLCHPETLRTMRWTVTKLKEAALQVLTT